ncbi:MAG: NADP-dependent isocitrate dehydrogenase, partial [Gemmatimonadetes bacterium]|nr:NADP-dependent isocitrate dehydrogenase [Gemmatimonadota bacterium]
GFQAPGARVLADALDAAVADYLRHDRSPGRDVGQLDNRGSTFYLTLYWARALAAQTEDAALADRFRPVAEALSAHEARIVEELNAAQGRAEDLGGYYMPDPARADAAMRPSPTLNGVLEGV